MKTVIIGGGASGISAAIRLKQLNSDMSVTVIEHLGEIMKKIYATGNGRCNITNKNAEHYDEVKDFLSSLGLILREDEKGRMYPYSNQASSVVEVFKAECEKLGIEILTDCNVKNADCYENTFHIYTDKGIIDSDYLILATGGKSQPPLGSDGSGYALSKKFGHKITVLSPALVQLKSSSKHCRALKGVRTKCNVKIETNGEISGEDYGEVLFTDYGISGIVVMNLSHLINDERLLHNKDKSVAILDFVPEMSENDLVKHYESFGTYEGILPKKLCSIISKQAGDNYAAMARCIKNWRIIITGTKGYDFAQITSGGVDLIELGHGNNSLIRKGLYIIGELTNSQFECGGFNLNYAIFSGINAANDITKGTVKNDKNK